ncbi:hypothetical protein J7E88_30680 [Streptomyces sp. ISL-10]|uniref:hypothetical protein n=1 Tax=Streptomyces sp. ISL-10 TaxID=2819172 RepID=UPI001BE5A301|nr:hypothetical protein [Streptomyces sp. ISL-10]MBT2369523.1 hypothetical protein [Streptomyces sp. ISL-10]
MTGVAILLAAVVEFIAVVALLDYYGKRRVKYSGEGVLAGAIAAAATNLMFLILQIKGGEYTPYLWIWIGLVLWSGWVIEVLSRQRIWATIPYPKSFALGVAISTAVGAASVAYSVMYVPYTTPEKVPFKASFGKPTVNSQRTVLYVPARVTFRNTGSVRIYVVGTLWAVEGVPATTTKQGTGRIDWKDALSYRRWIYRHESHAPSRMLGAGEFVNAGSRLDPGDDFSADINVPVPLNSDLHRVTVYAAVSYIRADRCKLGNSYAQSVQYSWNRESKGHEHLRDAPKWVANPGDDFIHYGSRIYRGSEILNLTQAPYYADMWWVTPKWNEQAGFAKGDTSPYLSVHISRDPGGQELLSESEQEPFGMKTMWIGTDQPITQLLKAAE